MYECKILKDSISGNEHSDRLTTFQVTFPRFILAEVNTHRMLSRNSASSRAIPVAKSIEAVIEDPFIPASFGKNQPGMSWAEDLGDDETNSARDHWIWAMGESVLVAEHLAHMDVHKALANRVLEPYKWHTAILTATDWSNFFALRTDANAQPEFRTIALMMQEAYEKSEPQILHQIEWHLPLVTDEEIFDESHRYPEPLIDWELWKKVSVGRCARVSYLTHDGKRDLDADVTLHDRLLTNGHLSPFEHVARPFTLHELKVIRETQAMLFELWYIDNGDKVLLERLSKNLVYCGNLHGWHSARYDIPNQDDFSRAVH